MSLDFSLYQFHYTYLFTKPQLGKAIMRKTCFWIDITKLGLGNEQVVRGLVKIVVGFGLGKERRV